MYTCVEEGGASVEIGEIHVSTAQSDERLDTFAVATTGSTVQCFISTCLLQ